MAAVAVNEAQGVPRVGRSTAVHCVEKGTKPRLEPVAPTPKRGMRSAACAIVPRLHVKNMVRSCTKRREKAPGLHLPGTGIGRRLQTEVNPSVLISERREGATGDDTGDEESGVGAVLFTRRQIL
ncbi:hypothetical protein NDU88_005452 [Pleurodeles waltl]|uniref:Uncharacterized protein n=1 Tax=Pleurodeles waltl TaxID=8319 RepID=A0AAV7M9C4_PLEWA|nr:hypothetical protein NDU88_005452 [Pleurodeles waltl]